MVGYVLCSSHVVYHNPLLCRYTYMTNHLYKHYNEKKEEERKEEKERNKQTYHRHRQHIAHTNNIHNYVSFLYTTLLDATEGALQSCSHMYNVYQIERNSSSMAYTCGAEHTFPYREVCSHPISISEKPGRLGGS